MYNDSNNNKKNDCKSETIDSSLLHVGGINDHLGGVDPEVDKNLERLSQNC